MAESAPDTATPDHAASAARTLAFEIDGLNALADKSDYRGITLRINGGYNGYAARLAFYEHALQVLPAAASPHA